MRLPRQPMNPFERRAVAGLAGIYATRMLGLFLVLPILANSTHSLPGYSGFMVGLALGIYGLTQAVFQVPLGVASDYLGRKPVIFAGLVIFALGSVVAAMADTMEGIILGRALQGMGAIAAAVLALAADLTRDEQRTKAMATIGITIGASFIVAMPMGPLLWSAIGLSGIFWFIAALAVLGMVVLVFVIPTPVHTPQKRELSVVRRQFVEVLQDKKLLRLDAGIFILHSVMTAMFVVVPLALVKYGELAADDHWQLYAPVMLLSILGMVPMIILAERRQMMRSMFVIAVLMLTIAQAILYTRHQSLAGLVAGVFVFFVAFNFLEASLPSLLSRMAPTAGRGAAVGVYSSFQFLGAFTGGVIGGWVFNRYGIGSVFVFCTLGLLAWFVIALGMPRLEQLVTRTIKVNVANEAAASALAEELARIAGVREAVVILEQATAYIKVDESRLDEAALARYQA
ncbi:MAG: MFS transporter [Gammaproteobacteria bacterium]|nr:MFS transporter [Gammaproteobacteria bacterium]